MSGTNWGTDTTRDCQCEHRTASDSEGANESVWTDGPKALPARGKVRAERLRVAAALTPSAEASETGGGCGWLCQLTSERGGEEQGFRAAAFQSGPAGYSRLALLPFESASPRFILLPLLTRHLSESASLPPWSIHWQGLDDSASDPIEGGRGRFGASPNLVPPPGACVHLEGGFVRAAEGLGVQASLGPSLTPPPGGCVYHPVGPV